MAQKAKTITAVTAGISVVVFIQAGNSAPPSGRPLWPKKQGVYLARSSDEISAFPRALSGFRSENNKDFWGHSFPCRGSLRVFKGEKWVGIPNFPVTMNGCDSGIFMVRWRSGYPDVRVSSTLGYFDGTGARGTENGAKMGSFGYIQASNCEQPMFKFAGAQKGNKSTLVNIYYELKFWQAAP